MVTTKKWIRETTATGGRLMISLRSLPLVVLSGLMCLSLMLVLLLVGCGEPPGQQEMKEGIRLLEAGKPAAAIPVFERATELFVTNQLARANALNYLGLAFHRAGRTDAADRAYQAALNEDLNLLEARYNRGCLLLETGDLEAATRELTTFVNLRPSAAEGWLRLGSAHLQANRIEEAAKAYREAGERATLDSVKLEALNGAGICLVRQGRLADAALFFNAAFKLDPDYPPVLLNQAILAERTNDTMGALLKYQVWLEATGEDPAREKVELRMQELVEALQPTMAEGGRATPEQLARLTNLFTRIGSLDAANATEAPETNAPPVAVVTSNPPPPVTITSNPPPVLAAISTPPPAGVITSNQPPAFVTATPPHRPTIDTAAPPVVSVSLGPSTRLADTDPAPTRPAAQTPPSRPPSTNLETDEPAPTKTPVASTEVDLVEESVPSRLELAMANPVPTQPPVPEEPDPQPSDEAAAPDETGEVSGAEEPGEKRSFLSKINPLNLFRRDPKEVRITPLPPRRGETTSPPVTPPESAPPVGIEEPDEPAVPLDVPPPEPEPEPVVTEPARPVYPRYAYTSPALPETGDPERAARLLETAARDHQAGRYAEAASGYEKAIKADPACFGARYNLATLELDRLRPEVALPEFETALVISPHEASARFNFALALEAAGYPLDAAMEMERALVDQPDNAAAHLMLGGLYSNTLEDIAKAREHFARVLAIDPQHPQAARIRRWLSAHR
jgi:tetratricopeptide (TPR) repeat protein